MPQTSTLAPDLDLAGLIPLLDALIEADARTLDAHRSGHIPDDLADAYVAAGIAVSEAAGLLVIRYSGASIVSQPNRPAMIYPTLDIDELQAVASEEEVVRKTLAAAFTLPAGPTKRERADAYTAEVFAEPSEDARHQRLVSLCRGAGARDYEAEEVARLIVSEAFIPLDSDDFASKARSILRGLRERARRGAESTATD